jgi:hypothetical protein
LHQLSGQVDSQVVLKGLEKTEHLEVDTLKNNYTMQAERLVHVSIASPQSSPESGVVFSTIPNTDCSVDEKEKDKETDLGDNVELF